MTDWIEVAITCHKSAALYVNQFILWYEDHQSSTLTPAALSHSVYEHRACSCSPPVIMGLPNPDYMSDLTERLFCAQVSPRVPQ